MPAACSYLRNKERTGDQTEHPYKHKLRRNSVLCRGSDRDRISWGMSSIVPETLLVSQKASGRRPGCCGGQSWQHMPGNENQPQETGLLRPGTRSRGRARDMKAAAGGQTEKQDVWAAGAAPPPGRIPALRPARAACQARPRPGPSTPWPTQPGPPEPQPSGLRGLCSATSLLCPPASLLPPCLH